MAGGGGKGAGKGASPAARLSDDEPNNRRLNFDLWKRKKRPNQMISYDKSPSPTIKGH